MTTAEFERHYAACNIKLLKFVQHKFGRDAEDIAAEAWLRAWRARDAFRGDSSFYTWLCTIAKNEIRTQLRREKLQRRDATVELTETVASGENLPHRMAAKFAVDRIFGDCTGQEVQILTMRFIYGFEFSEISNKLNVNMNTAKTQMHRRLRRLRRV